MYSPIQTGRFGEIVRDRPHLFPGGYCLFPRRPYWLPETPGKHRMAGGKRRTDSWIRSCADRQPILRTRSDARCRPFCAQAQNRHKTHESIARRSEPKKRPFFIPRGCCSEHPGAAALRAPAVSIRGCVARLLPWTRRRVSHDMPYRAAGPSRGPEQIKNRNGFTRRKHLESFLNRRLSHIECRISKSFCGSKFDIRNSISRIFAAPQWRSAKERALEGRKRRVRIPWQDILCG